MKSLLALDLGTNCGWAVRNRDGNITHDVAKFPTSRFSGAGMRFVHFRKFLSDLLADGAVDLVYFEEVHNHGKAGVAAAHLYGGFLAVMTSYCETHSIPYQGVGVGTIKRFWSGRGNCGKPEMVDQAIKRGFKVDDDNVADALAILHYGMQEVGA